MTNSSLRKHIVIFIALIVTLCAATFVVWRLVLNMHQKEKMAISANEQLATYRENKKIFSEESKMIFEIEERLDKIESFQVTTETTPALLSSIEELAKKNNIVFAITSVQTPGTVALGKKMMIDFSAKGTEQDLDKFLRSLDHQVYQIKFNKLSFASNKDSIGTADDREGQSNLTSANKVTANEWEVLASIQVMSF